MGNEKANAFWEAELPHGFQRPPEADRASLETFIRTKYEARRWVSRSKEPRDSRETEARDDYRVRGPEREEREEYRQRAPPSDHPAVQEGVRGKLRGEERNERIRVTLPARHAHEGGGGKLRMPEPPRSAHAFAPAHQSPATAPAPAPAPAPQLVDLLGFDDAPASAPAPTPTAAPAPAPAAAHAPMPAAAVQPVPASQAWAAFPTGTSPRLRGTPLPMSQ